MKNHFDVLEIFIKETGQEKGSVSGDMALNALGMIKNAVLAEREECAALMDELGAIYTKVVGHQQVGDILADVEQTFDAGEAIRARGGDNSEAPSPDQHGADIESYKMRSDKEYDALKHLKAANV